jgi:hypothetical protein
VGGAVGGGVGAAVAASVGSADSGVGEAGAAVVGSTLSSGCWEQAVIKQIISRNTIKRQKPATFFLYDYGWGRGAAFLKRQLL